MKKFLMFLIMLVVVLGVVSQFLPADYSVSRSVVIAAEPAEVYPHIATLKTWPEWTAWTPERDPEATWTFDGPESGVGAKMTWNGEELGQGMLVVTEGSPTQGLSYDLAFDEGKYNSKGKFTLVKEAGATKVTWFDEGDLGKNPISRYFGLVMDKMMGPEFETGLQGLKTRVESAKAN